MFALIQSTTGWNFSSKGCLRLLSAVALIVTTVFVCLTGGWLIGGLFALATAALLFLSDNVPVTVARVVGAVIGIAYVIITR